jgi:signal peptidase II
MTRLLLLLSLPLYLIDQVSKHWIMRNYELNGPEETIIENFFWLHHTANTGVAFGMGNGTAWANYLFGFVSIAAAALIITLWKRGAFPGKISQTAAALLIAGIAGNLTDRFWVGYVVDFLRFDLKVMMWPSFNVADSCVVCAAILLFLSSFFEKPKTEAKT